MSDMIDAPKGYVVLKDMFNEEKEEAIYSQFLNHRLSFDRLVLLCKKLGHTVDEKMVTGIMLPIHQKDSLKGTILVHKEVEKHFDMYKLAQSYMEYKADTSEHQLGIAMSYDIKFNDYVLRCEKRRAVEGKDPDPDNFTEEFNACCKRIAKIKH